MTSKSQLQLSPCGFSIILRETERRKIIKILRAVCSSNTSILSYAWQLLQLLQMQELRLDKKSEVRCVGSLSNHITKSLFPLVIFRLLLQKKQPNKQITHETQGIVSGLTFQKYNGPSWCLSEQEKICKEKVNSILNLKIYDNHLKYYRSASKCLQGLNLTKTILETLSITFALSWIYQRIEPIYVLH